MDPAIWWYLARASGLVAWALAVTSLLLGLALSTRALGPKPKGPWLLDMHRWTGGLTIVFTGVHVAALIADTFVTFRLVDVLLPFATSWKPVAVAWGIISMWLLVAIEVSSLLMKRIPKPMWHAIHLSSYVVAVLATVHGLTAGTDTANSIFAWVMAAAIAAGVFFSTYRRLAPAKAARRIPPRPVPKVDA